MLAAGLSGEVGPGMLKTLEVRIVRYTASLRITLLVTLTIYLATPQILNPEHQEDEFNNHLAQAGEECGSFRS